MKNVHFVYFSRTGLFQQIPVLAILTCLGAVRVFYFQLLPQIDLNQQFSYWLRCEN